MYTYNKNSHKSSGFCECENRSLLRMDPSAVERGNLTRVQPARGGQSSEMAGKKRGKKNRKQNARVLRFFYCIPIGTLAYMVWASHRSAGGIAWATKRTFGKARWR